MQQVKLLLVTGPGGARMDFVAGWLGTLPGFVDTRWYIDTTTGLSIGDTHFTKGLDRPGSDISDVMSGHNMCLSSNSNLIWAGSNHGNQLHNYKTLNADGKLDILHIDITGADLDQIHWEFLAKTFLTCRRHITNYINQSLWIIDQQINKEKNSISDADRIKKFEELLSNKMEFFNPNLENLKYTTVEYDKLFQPGGSKYLVDLLKTTASDRQHAHWDHALTLSTTPETITAWGRSWTKPAR
jgi:hypothetical protein